MWRAQSLSSHAFLGALSSVLSFFFLSVSFSLLRSLHTFSLTDSLYLLCSPLTISSRKKPDDLRLPSFSLPRLSSLSLLCVVRYVSCGKHHRMMGGRHLLYIQTPPRDHGEAHTVTRAAQWIMLNEWLGFLLGYMGFKQCMLLEGIFGTKTKIIIDINRWINRHIHKITFCRGQSNLSSCCLFSAEGKYCTSVTAVSAR